MSGNGSSLAGSPTAFRPYQVMAAIGIILLAVGLFLEPPLAWANILMVSYGLVCLGLAGAVFVALHYVTGASWSAPLRPLQEMITRLLPIGAIGLLVVFIVYPILYPWLDHAGGEGHGPAAFRHWWLTWPFFLGRAAFYLACWLLLAWALVRASRRAQADAKHTTSCVRWSALFLVVFGATFWLASYDWIMSLEPEWFSTIFGLYNFAGLFLSGLAVILLLALRLRRRGPLRHVLTADRLHDLGKLLFAFSTFWAYIWFCQYMLIWYVNNPEETPYYLRRLEGAWQPLFYLNLALNWGVPFFVLLPRSMKRSPEALGKIAWLILLGRWLDLYLMIFPSLEGASPWPGPAGVGAIVFGLGVFALVALTPGQQPEVSSGPALIDRGYFDGSARPSPDGMLPVGVPAGGPREANRAER